MRSFSLSVLRCEGESLWDQRGARAQESVEDGLVAVLCLRILTQSGTRIDRLTAEQRRCDLVGALRPLSGCPVTVRLQSPTGLQVSPESPNIRAEGPIDFTSESAWVLHSCCCLFTSNMEFTQSLRVSWICVLVLGRCACVPLQEYQYPYNFTWSSDGESTLDPSHQSDDASILQRVRDPESRSGPFLKYPGTGQQNNNPGVAALLDPDLFDDGPRLENLGTPTSGGQESGNPVDTGPLDPDLFDDGPRFGYPGVRTSVKTPPVNKTVTQVPLAGLDISIMVVVRDLPDLETPPLVDNSIIL
ncbi:uncharacterized protein LOC116685492 [Etheostoma spectabile]|uniref:uncharacterized protein LOC116685492 n=1 Tax=Etheostoma spectabile TaxID=54343 RepID=UPI0013AEC87C|nr:uncharacterized protein LOC116685492 [Etheostoma spectabile]